VQGVYPRQPAASSLNEAVARGSRLQAFDSRKKAPGSKQQAAGYI